MFMVKLAIWFVFGAAGIVMLLASTDIQTSWQYTLKSTVGAGSSVTVSKEFVEAAEAAEAELAMHAETPLEVPEVEQLLYAGTPLPISVQKTVDVGAPASLIIVFLFASILTYGLKSRRAIG